MLHTKAPLITRHDYQEMPDGPPYSQVIEGELVMAPSLNLFHQDISGNIFRGDLRGLGIFGRSEYVGPRRTPCSSPSVRARPGGVCIHSDQSNARRASPSLPRSRRQ